MNTSQQLYSALESISLEEFSALFSSVRQSAFRLELLEQYLVDFEKEYFRDFLEGKPKPAHSINAEWCEMIAKSSAEFSRVRYTRKPIHPYTQFEIAWGYPASMSAGETIRVIVDDSLPQFEANVPILKDFWLFNDEICVLMEYDVIGNFLGAKKLPPEHVSRYVELKEEALQHSVSIQEAAGLLQL